MEALLIAWRAVQTAAWACAIALAGTAWAAEPLVTDDASILDPGVCQFESWHRWSTNGGHEGWGVPACSVNRYLELGAGFARRRDAESGGHTLLMLQAKTVFLGDPDGPWSAGAVANLIRDGARDPPHRGAHEATLTGLASFNFLDGRLRLHANAGVAWSRDDYTTGVWGVATEYDVAPYWTLMGEVFRDRPGPSSFQLGVRYTLVTDRVELFLSGGDRLHERDGSWFAKFGVRFESWKMF